MNIKVTRRLAMLFLFFLPALLSAQQGNVWYFGDMAGLDFSSGSPVVLTDGAIQTFEGCASFCDENGQLLFYTNGGGRDPVQSGQTSGKIWNRNHELMYDMGNEEGGGFSAAQSSIIIPRPGAEQQYYLFTMEETEFNTGGSVPGQPQGRGLSYFEIDMSLNGGLGEVTLADQSVHIPSYEGLSGTLHNNSQDYWIIAHENENSDNNRFVVVLVNEEGVQEPFFADIPPNNELRGIIKISPSGEWLYCNGFIYTFDNATGQIGLPGIDIQQVASVNTASFSANSRYLYCIENGALGQEAIQYDLQSSDIPASRNNFASIGKFVLTGLMQLAPDGNIYFLDGFPGNEQVLDISVIRCANTSSPELSRQVISPTAGSEYLPFSGLPNFTDHIFAQDEITLEVNLGPDTLRICEVDSTILDAGNPGAEYFWSTGETTQTIQVAEGTYSVTVTSNCGEASDEIVVLLGGEGPLSASITGPDLICEGETATLTAEALNASAFEWSTGDMTAQIQVSEAGSYSVTVTGGCEGDETATAMKSLQVANAPQVEIIGGDEGKFCIGDTAVLQAQGLGFDSLRWSTGETADEIVVDSGLVALSVFSACGETIDSVFVSYIDCDTLECIVMAPNIFTPNGDGINDTFGPVSTCEDKDLLEYNIKVFNRWGNLVFESSESMNEWDGQQNGKPAPTEAYFYIIQYASPTGPPEVMEEVKTLKGNVTLAR